MNKKTLFLIVALCAVAAPFASEADFASPYFGGTVVATQLCNTGMLITVKEMFGVEQLMWLTGELPYLMYSPPHIGQLVLGMDAVSATCTLGTTVQGQGKVILFHGETL